MKRILTAVLSAALVATSALAVSAPASAAPSTKTQFTTACGAKNSVVFLAARGSGETGHTGGVGTKKTKKNPTPKTVWFNQNKNATVVSAANGSSKTAKQSRYYGFGERLPLTVTQTIKRINAKAGSKKVHYSYLPVAYEARILVSKKPLGNPAIIDATSDYKESLAGGYQDLSQTLNNLSKYCPNAQVILLGYSQGAHAIHHTLAKVPSAHVKKYAKFISSAHLIADPIRNTAKDKNIVDVQIGKGKPNKTGLFGLSSLNTPKEFKVFSYCARSDVICDAKRPISLSTKNDLDKLGRAFVQRALSTEAHNTAYKSAGDVKDISFLLAAGYKVR